jgi:hypothetical protein
MQEQVDFTRLVSCSEYIGEDAEDHALIREMIERANSFLRSFDWCAGIAECYMGDVAVGGVVAAILFRIEPAREGVDEWLWVVVGDVPPAYLVTDDAATASAALERYIEEMQRWIDAVEAGESIDELIPVATSDGSTRLEPTPAIAEELSSRLRFLNEKVLRGM